MNEQRLLGCKLVQNAWPVVHLTTSAWLTCIDELVRNAHSPLPPLNSRQKQKNTTLQKLYGCFLRVGGALRGACYLPRGGSVSIHLLSSLLCYSPLACSSLAAPLSLPHPAHTHTTSSLEPIDVNSDELELRIGEPLI